MRALGCKPINWDENIVALAEKGGTTAEEFLATNPITFGEKIWGKYDWNYGCYVNNPMAHDMLDDKIYYKILEHYYAKVAEV
jgi:hypothetical protein